jgi:hypothetical protein
MPAEETRAYARFMLIDRAFVKSFVQGAPAELVKFTKSRVVGLENVVRGL